MSLAKHCRLVSAIAHHQPIRELRAVHVPYLKDDRPIFMLIPTSGTVAVAVDVMLVSNIPRLAKQSECKVGHLLVAPSISLWAS